MSRLNLRAAFYGGPGFTLYHAWGPNSAMVLDPHFHDEYLICAQIRGEEECQVSGKIERFSAGDIVLINPQQVHTGNARGSDDLEYLSLYVDRELVAELADELSAASKSPEFTVVRAGPQPALAAKLATLLERIRDDAAAGSAPDDPPTLSVQDTLHEVVALAFAEFSNLHQPMLRSSKRIGHRKVARAIDYIHDLERQSGNPPQVSLDDLAEIAGLSKFHFLRQFSQVVGMTPGAYLRTLRLCHAARKLRTTDLPILEIALSVGFADHPSFSRAFARHMGMTPSDYQRLGQRCGPPLGPRLESP